MFHLKSYLSKSHLNELINFFNQKFSKNSEEEKIVFLLEELLLEYVNIFGVEHDIALKIISEVCKITMSQNANTSQLDRLAIEKKLLANLFSLGPLDDLLHDSNISEVVVVEDQKVVTGKDLNSQKENYKISKQHILRFQERICWGHKMRISEKHFCIVTSYLEFEVVCISYPFTAIYFSKGHSFSKGYSSEF